MSMLRLPALILLGCFAAMIAVTWWYGITGGPLVKQVGPFGLLLILAATLVAMLVIALWRRQAPIGSTRAPGWQREKNAEDVELELRREAAYDERQRRSAEASASNSFKGKSGF